MLASLEGFGWQKQFLPLAIHSCLHGWMWNETGQQVWVGNNPVLLGQLSGSASGLSVGLYKELCWHSGEGRLLLRAIHEMQIEILEVWDDFFCVCLAKFRCSYPKQHRQQGCIMQFAYKLS